MYKFTIGQIVHHKLYDYRGVIVDMDPECRAPDEWYEKNQTQPPRDEPWYQVLVDGGKETYVAERNLEIDEDASEITHPMVKKFFPTYHEGRYYLQSRN